MHQLIYENLFVFILAGLSGFDLVKSLANRAYKRILGIPLKSYVRLVAKSATAKRHEFCGCGEGS